MGHGECEKERACPCEWTWKPTLDLTRSPGATVGKTSQTQPTTSSPQARTQTGTRTRGCMCALLLVSSSLWWGCSVVVDYFFFLYSYHSQLKLVRLKVSESGMYTFLANNGDATVRLTFEIYVLSKFLKKQLKSILKLLKLTGNYCERMKYMGYMKSRRVFAFLTKHFAFIFR